MCAELGVPSVRMVHGQPDIGQLEGAALVVFNSETSRALVDWTGPAVVCRPVTWPDEHRVTATGDRWAQVNLSPAKGGELFRLIVTSLPDVKFLAVRGGYGGQVMPTRSANVEIMAMTGEMRDVWSRARGLLMPSESETWGMVAVEAAVNGLPVIAHPCAGIIEALGDAPVYVDRDDLAGWRAAIRELDDPVSYAERSAASTAAAARLDPHDSVARFVTAVETIGAPHADVATACHP